ncbi:hypothetical protein C0Q70_08244 [Pomacea canaliculata]|uniref:TLDc domain-containing protein n=1 Tax=Pomacea canaliculata TaxID=400727 RepID=A0A2T7PHA9_POMCA|nr:restriction of telomere capping protein 5-like [Pomacea canaliculata]PVD32798.1 hypothetical protein C0Q70_08244 [Pomacea canaliculata]
MGNALTQKQSTVSVDESASGEELSGASSMTCSTSILKLFEKLELTADEGNTHPGELSRKTFENAFHGPLHKFGKLMFRQMTNSHVERDRITREEFVTAGTEIVNKFDVTDQRKYYIKLFAEGKDYLTKEDAFQMVHVSYVLTVSVSKISFKHDDRDVALFEGMVTSMFGIEDRIGFSHTEQWMVTHCPNIFSGVHSWVYMVLSGSNLPSEMEARTAHVPQLENFISGQHCLSLGMAWVLSAVLPNSFTHTTPQPQTSGAQSNPMLTNFQLYVSLARLPRVQSWALLYNSERDGLSRNRFSHHILSYHGHNLTFVGFEGRNLYCLALDCGWKESLQKIGGPDCRLIQLLPVYRVIQAGSKMVLWNMSSRNLPKGIQVGQDGKPLVLKINDEFESVSHYGVPCVFHRMEVWGCGGEDVKRAQVKQKQWEAQEVEKHKSQKLRLEGDWRENPDKQILEWGGVRTGSSYSEKR